MPRYLRHEESTGRPSRASARGSAPRHRQAPRFRKRHPFGRHHRNPHPVHLIKCQLSGIAMIGSRRPEYGRLHGRAPSRVKQSNCGPSAHDSPNSPRPWTCTWNCSNCSGGSRAASRALARLSAETFARHQAEGRPLLPFDAIPLELTDLRLMVRQTADVLRRFGALDDEDYQTVQAVGRDMKLLAVVGDWYRKTAERPRSHPRRWGTSGRRLYPAPRTRSRKCSAWRCGRSCRAARRSCSSGGSGDLDPSPLPAVRRDAGLSR